MHLSRTEERTIEYKLNVLDYRLKSTSLKVIGIIYRILQVYLNNMIPTKSNNINTFKLWFYGINAAVVITFLVALTHQH